MDEEQNIVGNRSAERPHLFREEVCGPDRFDVPLNKIVPGAAATFGAGIETMFLQDAADGCPGDLADAELPEFAE